MPSSWPCCLSGSCWPEGAPPHGRCCIQAGSPSSLPWPSAGRLGGAPSVPPVSLPPHRRPHLKSQSRKSGVHTGNTSVVSGMCPSIASDRNRLLGFVPKQDILTLGTTKGSCIQGQRQYYRDSGTLPLCLPCGDQQSSFPPSGSSQLQQEERGFPPTAAQRASIECHCFLFSWSPFCP